MGSMTQDYYKSQKRIREAQVAQQDMERNSPEWKAQERIIVSEMGAWN